MTDYQLIIDFVLESGKRIMTKAGNVADIGITKIDLTEEDLRIERGFKEIIKSFGEDHVLYAEEENEVFKNAENLWVADPISGTSAFIKGLPHYSIVISHLVNHQIVFACVYDPAVDELFTARGDQGAFLNGNPIHVSENTSHVILRVSKAKVETEKDLVERISKSLSQYDVTSNHHSMAVDYCAVACGRYDGIISISKDTFPEFAGSLIIREAGGEFTNSLGDSNFEHTDRLFVGGNKEMFKQLLPFVCGASIITS